MPLLALLCALLVVICPAFGADRLAVPGTTVSLVPPDGFTPAGGFSGFEMAEIGGSVVVVELPADSRAEVSAIFADVGSARAAFAAQGVSVVRLDRVSTAGGEAVLLTGTQDAAGQRFDKWIALFHGARTVLVTVQALQAAELPSGVVEATIASVSLGAAPTLAGELDALPFTVRAEAPFRVVGTVMGSSALMTVGDLDVDPSGAQPLLIVASQISAPVDPSALNAVAQEALEQTEALAQAVVTERVRVPFAGTEGVRLEGTYLDAGRARRFAQYLATRADGRFVRLVFMADEAGFAQLRPAVTAIAATVAFAPR